MLTLNDGRSELWQWDTGRKLTVDADCSQVHFSNKVFGRSIDVDVVDGVAVIPDILLQTDKDLNVWAFVGTPENGYTKISKVFKVNKRNKPADYVFTPPEQTTLEEIKEKLDYLESIQDPDAIKNAVDEYLANNPIQIDEKDPTVPDWAKQTTKPKYTATEVGAVAKVNGVKPDANGNVEITIQDSGGNVALTADQISALDGMFKVCGFIKDDVSAEYNAFKTAFGITDSGEDEPDEPVIPDEPDTPEKTLTSISATYSGGEVAVGTAVTALTGIVVTAHYSDGTSEAVTGYTLSGTIVEGSNTITVSYGGMTTTFTVTGVAESGGEEEPEAFGVSEISANSIKYKDAIVSATSGTEYKAGFKYRGEIVSINVEAGKTYMLMGMNSDLTATMNTTLSVGKSPVGDEPMAVNLNADGSLGDTNTSFNPTYISLANVDPYKQMGFNAITGKKVFWSGAYTTLGKKESTSFVETVDETEYAWCVCIFTANIDFSGIVQWNGLTLVNENYFRIYEVDPNTEYNPYLDGVIGIGEER